MACRRCGQRGRVQATNQRNAIRPMPAANTSQTNNNSMVIRTGGKALPRTRRPRQ
jgi:hypothetical protein